MALRPEYSLGHSEFNDFLFACVGEEKSGAELTVLSALARLGLDPWAEAVRLSELTKEAATNALATAIHSLPEGDWKASDVQSIAARLIARLPKFGSMRTNSTLNGNTGDQRPTLKVQKWLIWIGLGLTVLMVLSRLFGD
jgi:hypothetical protein